MGARALLQPRSLRQVSLAVCRPWSSSSTLSSGHNRWSKIKHNKAKADAGKSKERTYLALNIIRASKDGGPDPKMNTSLAFAIANAKKGQLSKEAIERSIAKGQGKSVSGAALEPVTIEAMLPHGVSAIIECQTDNKTRILQDIRSIIAKAGGSVTPTTFLFDKKGKVWFQPQETVGVDEAMDEAIEAGAEDVIMEDGKLVVETQPESVSAVAQRLKETLKLEIERSEILYDPKEESLITLDETQALELQVLLDTIEQQDDLQALYINAAL